MSVRIRLKRTGKKNQPYYRIVAADSRTKRGGREIELLGTYNPRTKGTFADLALKRDRIKYWLDCGAQVSDTIASLLKAQGMLPTRLAKHEGVRS